jgi:hypothetical protein
MNKPIPDKAEVAIEYPDKLYIGTFERSSRFDAHFDEHGISLTLERKGDPRPRSRRRCRWCARGSASGAVRRELLSSTSS